MAFWLSGSASTLKHAGDAANMWLGPLRGFWALPLSSIFNLSVVCKFFFYIFEIVLISFKVMMLLIDLTSSSLTESMLWLWDKVSAPSVARLAAPAECAGTNA